MLHYEYLSIEKLVYLDTNIQTTPLTIEFSWTEKIFYFLHLLLPKDSIILPFACFFVAISFCQILSLMIDPQTQFGSNASLGGFFPYLLTQTTLEPLLMYCTYMTLYLFVLDLVAFLIFVLTFMGVWSRIFPVGNVASLLRAIVPTIYWIGIIPITYYLFSIWNCQGNYHPIASDLQCWSLLHIIQLCILSIALVIWTFLLLPSFVFLMAYADIENDNPFAHFYSGFELNYLLLRFFLSAIEALNNTGIFFYFLLGLTIISVLYFFYLIGNSFPYYNRMVSLIFTSSLFSTAFITTFSIMLSLLGNFFINVVGTSSILTIFVILSCGLSYNLKKRRINCILKNQVQESPEELDTLAILCAYKAVWKFYVEDIDDVTLEGFFALHKKHCNKPDCPLCFPDNISSILQENNSDDSDESKNERKMIVQRHFILYLWNNKANKDITDIRIVLQISRMYLILLGNANLAYAKLVEASTMDPSWIMQFILYCTKMNIIAFVEGKKAALFKKEVCNFYEVLELEAIHERIFQMITLSAEKRYDFWNELKNDMPSLNLLRDLGYNQLEINIEIEKLWKAITDIYPNHIESVDLYSKYIIYVLGEVESGRILSEKLAIMPELRQTKELNKNILFSNEAASIIISGNSLETGHIVKASKKVKDIFNFNPTELIGRDITILMPKVIGLHHYKFIKNYSLPPSYTAT